MPLCQRDAEVGVLPPATAGEHDWVCVTCMRGLSDRIKTASLQGHIFAASQYR